MKKTLLTALMLTLVSGSLWADELGSNRQWIERVEGAFAVPASGDSASQLDLGFGGGLALGYRLDSHSSVSIASGYYQYDLKNDPAGYVGGNFSYVPLDAVFTYNFGDGEFRPYVSFGAGAAFNTYTLSINTQGSTVESHAYETGLFLSPAIGFFEVIGPKAAFFMEARADMDFRSNNTLGMSNGAPSIFVPIQAGLAFFVI